MDGSYNQPFGHGHGHGPSQLNSPQTPSSATYQTNVNRSKTRKWVEARQQTYDGDDWGTDDFEQEPDSPPYQQPSAPSSSRLASYGQRTPSSAIDPDTINPPALHIPTQQAAPPAQLAHYPADVGAPSEPQGPPMADPSTAKSSEQVVSPENTNSFATFEAPPQHTSISGFPVTQAIAPSYAEHTDHFGRVERKNTTRKPVGSANPSAGNAVIDVPPVPGTPQETSSVPQQEEDIALSNAEDIDRHRLSTSPQLPDVARMSAFGLDLFSGNTKRVSAMAPPPTVEEAEPTSPEPGPSAGSLAERAAVENQSKDGAVAEAPQPLADPPAVATAAEQAPAAVESMESTTAAPLTVEKTDGDVPSQMWRPSVPGEQVSQDQPAPSTAVIQPAENDISPISEHDPETAATLNPNTGSEADKKPATLQPEQDEPAIAPLRTPSPRVSQVLPAAGEAVRVEPSRLQTSVPTAAHAEPLETRVPEYSPSDYDPKSLQREATFSTVTSSPLKESDILRDEIIKSLSPQNDTAPVNFPPPAPQERIDQPVKSGPRESTYTLSGYDSYWAEKDLGTQPTVAEEQEEADAVETVPEEQTGTTPKQKAAAPAAVEAQQIDTPTEPDARRRFSWEAEGEDAKQVPAGGEEKVPSTVDQVTPTADKNVPLANVNVLVDGPETEKPDNTEPSSAYVSHQVSQASSSRPPVGQGQLATPGPPSPVSDPSERTQAPATEDRRPSLAEQKSLVRSEASPVAPSPPSGTHPALAPSPTTSQTPASQPPLMTFREIMGLSSAQERVSKYDEARTRFATIESGLSDWIANLKASHPEHASASASFGGSLTVSAGDPSIAPSPVGGQAPSQQPYYQQYLNASSPTTANAPGRSRLGGISSSGQSHSAFGHSSDKIGTKSKEFMQSAGKMGKGLFSKGKSKLRGTGDKQADVSPPATPVQGKTKSDRRSSWALSLGNRPRAEGVGMHSNADKLGHQPIGHSSQPSTETGPSSLAKTRSGADQTSLRGPLGPGSGSGPLGPDARHDASGLMAPSTPNGTDRSGHNRDVSLPLTLDKDADEATWDPFNGTPYARRKSPASGDVLLSESNDPDTRVSGDWVVVPRESIGSRGQQPPRTAPEDSGIGMSSQVDDRPTGLKRDPSFGLPLIRRSTTLDFGLKDALDSGNEPGKPPGQGEGSEHAIAATKTGSDGTPIGLPAPVSGERDSVDTGMAQPNPMNSQLPAAPYSRDQDPGRAQERSQAQASLPLLQTQTSGQKAVKPPGPWKLEESYLSEPLHQVSRKRSGTNDSQQVTYGLDKEMGITASSPISPPTMIPRQRGGNQLPPSSAQRYPELFTNAQPQNGPRERSNSGSNMIGAGFPRTESNEFDIPGVGPPEERGRRKSSSIFKEFGNRIGRASSRDRRPSVSDGRPTTSEIVRPDGASETSVWADNPDRRKKRSSLLSGLRSRPSMEMTTQANDLRPENGPTIIQSQGLGASASQNALPLTSEEERRSKSVFGTDKLKLRSSRTEKWDSTGPEDQSEPGAAKSRLSGFGGKVAGLAGAFRRPMSEQSQAHSSSSMAANDFNEEARQASQQQRQSTMPPPPPLGEPHGGRGRRGSASGVLSGLLGRSSSRTREQQGPHSGQQAFGESGRVQMYAGRASMDQRTSAPDPSPHQTAHSASIRPVGQSPPPDMPRNDVGAIGDAGRFETVSPELSVRSGGQNAPTRGAEDPRTSGQGLTGSDHANFTHDQRPHLPQNQSSDVSRPGPPPSGPSPPLGGYYGPRQLPHGQPPMQQPVHQQMQMQPQQHQGSSGPPNPQSSDFLRQHPSKQDMLNIPGSRHSSLSLQSSNQGRPLTGPSEGQQGSRWRGFKNRISGQLAPQNQDKAGEKEDRMSGSKLFGAFKRGSKQHSAPPVALHQNASRSQQWVQQQQQQPYQQGLSYPGPQSQPQHMMDQRPPHMQQGLISPHQQQQFTHPQGHHQRPGMGPNPYDSYQRQPSTGGSPGQQQQPFPPGQGPVPGMPGPQSTPLTHGSHEHRMQPDTQYEQVPIPAAYSVASGQGNMFNMDRQMQNYSTSFQYNSPGKSPPPNQWQHDSRQHGMHGPDGSMPLPGPPSDAHVSSQTPPDVDNRHLSGAQGLPAPFAQDVKNMPPAGRTSPPKPAHPLGPSPPPASILPPPPSIVGRPEYARGDSEVLPLTQGGLITRKPTIPQSKAERQAPRTPVTANQRVNGEETKNTANLSVDVAKAEADKEDDIYDATPRVVQAKTGQKSPEPPAQSPSPVTKAVPATTASTTEKKEPGGGASFAMELEDTEEARKRTIRLDSQEEKIFYDPADDDDNPTMSATSYPGQEWNPYGEFEYSDVGDEPQHESVRGR